MLLKITDFPDDLAETLCAITGERTGSKAVMATIREFMRLTEWEASAQLRMAAMALEIERLNHIVEGARSAAALLVEKTGQGDLLQPVPFLRKIDHFED